MNGARFTLEQFAVGVPGIGFGDMDASSVDGFDLPSMDDPLIHPAPALDDPGVAETEALEEQLLADRARLAALIEALEQDRARQVQSAVEQAAERVAAIGAELLGTVIDRGFTHEIAAAVVELVGRIPAPTATIAIADQDHEALAALIAAACPDREITVISDPALSAGMARMSWPDGGADFSRESLADRVAPLIAERLSDLKPRSEP